MRVNTVLLIVGLLLLLLTGTFIASIGSGMIGWVIGGMLYEDLVERKEK